VVSAVALAIVTNGSVGWKTVRTRWENDLADYSPTLHHIEDHARWASDLTENHAKSIGLALSGRAAAREAIRSGANIVLLSTLQNAPFVPLPLGVNYAVYGDCTTAQLAELYGGKTLGFPGSFVNARLRRLVDHGCYFLCMSEWYRDALRREFGVGEDRLVMLPFYVDTEKWKPAERKAPNARPQVLFIGGDFRRKGGDVVNGLARLERFENVDFHVVSPHAEAGPPNVRVHRSLAPESADLVRLTAASDIFILPTRADTSSLAAMEAAACGVAAIVTRCGGIPEIVRDGSTGSVLDAPSVDAFAEQLSAYLANPSMVAERGRNARQHILRNYSKTVHLTALRDVIARAAAEVPANRQAPRGTAVTASPGTAACSADRTPRGQARTTSERRG
jgi:glycosyltransferase involved in cell wall biosynthesis